MDTIELDRYKQLLVAKRDELWGGPLRTTLLVADGPRGALGDFTDQGTEEAQTALQAYLSQSDSHLLRAIEDALARIDRGVFGVCEVCKRPIAEARLKTVPWARLCRDCKEQRAA